MKLNRNLYLWRVRIKGQRSDLGLWLITITIISVVYHIVLYIYIFCSMVNNSKATTRLLPAAKHPKGIIGRRERTEGGGRRTTRPRVVIPRAAVRETSLRQSAAGSGPQRIAPSRCRRRSLIDSALICYPRSLLVPYPVRQPIRYDCSGKRYNGP